MAESATFTETLPVDLTHDEKLAFGSELAACHAQLGEIELEEAGAKAQIKEKKAGVAKRINALAGDLHRGKTDRQVECRNRFDYERNVVSLVRLDTGEVVRERPMKAAERQQPIPMRSKVN